MNIFSQNSGSYESYWKELSSFKEKNQPKSALSVVDKIITKSRKEGNNSQLLQAMFTRLELNEDLDPDSLTNACGDIENLLEGIDDKCEVAIGKILLSYVYSGFDSRYYTRDASTREKYDAKARECRQSVFEDKETLAKSSAKSYLPLTIINEDSETYFGHDMLSLLSGIVLSMPDVEDIEKKELLDDVISYYYSTGRTTDSKLARLKQMQLRLENMDVRSIAEKKQGAKYDEFIKIREEVKSMMNYDQSKELQADAYLVYIDNIETDVTSRLQLAEEALNKFSDSKRKYAFQKTKEEILCPSVNVSVPDYCYPSQEIPVALRYTNCESIGFKITDSKSNKVVVSRNIKTEYSPVEHCDTVMISLPAGRYSINADYTSTSGKTDTRQTRVFMVGTLKTVVMYSAPLEGFIVHVLDYNSGRPVPSCEVTMTSVASRGNENNKKETKTTDADGRVFFDQWDKSRRNIFVAKRSDTDCSQETEGWFSVMRGNNRNDAADIRTHLFTDRSIYRPGQTVEVTALAYTQDGDAVAVSEGTEGTFVLMDANYQQLAEVKSVTDAYGKASAKLAIPEISALTGRYIVEFKDSSNRTFRGGTTSVRVEEYKRPTFKAELDKYDKTYVLNDEIEMSGRASMLTGSALQNGKVSYKVEASERPWWIWRGFGGTDWHTVSTGETTTDENGNFAVPVSLVLPKEMTTDDMGDKVYLFKVSADVVSLSGEVQSCNRVLSVSQKDFCLVAETPQNINREKGAEIKVVAMNSQNEEQHVEGTWTLLRWTDEGEVASGRFTTGTPLSIDWKQIPGGTYKLKTEATDSHGNQINHTSEAFTVYSLKSRKMNNLSEAWIYCEDATFNEDKDAEILYSPASDDVTLYTYVVSNNGIADYKKTTANASVETIRLKYKKEYGDGVSVVMFYVKDGIVHKMQTDIRRTVPDKKLKLTWKTFRDRLQPGQDETWELSVLGPDGKPAASSVLATMYDASLDMLSEHEWSFGLTFPRRLPSIDLRYYGGKGSSVISYSQNLNTHKLLEKSYRHFDHLSFIAENNETYMPYYDVMVGNSWLNMFEGRHFYSGMNVMMRSAAAVRPMAKSNVALQGRIAGLDMEEAASESADMEDDMEQETAALGAMKDTDDIDTDVLRSDFAETAFYYPTLTSDKDGNVTISFRLPESLTEWHFMGFANTRDMNYGLIDGIAKAQKEFTVQPNMPRFLRDGDETRITALLVNQSDKYQEGTAIMTITDAESGEELYVGTQTFEVKPNGSSNVRFGYKADAKHPMLVCKIVAQGKDFSDGEQHYLPVLDSRQRILETETFYLTEEGKSAKVELPNTSTHDKDDDMKITVEYTDTPAWTVIQAIQTLVNTRENDAVSYSASLYANSIAKGFRDRLPGLQQVIEQWKTEDGPADQMKSPLTENEDLRNLLQRETPWVLNAEKETEQRARLVDLFDADLLNRRTNEAQTQLKKMQMDNGAWPWFNGMDESAWITLMVSEHLTNLYAKNLLEDEGKDMLNRAMIWLDKEIVKQYNRKLQYSKKPVPSEFDLHYIYISYISEHKPTSGADKIRQHYLDYVEKNKNGFTIYGWAQIASLLDAAGRRTKAFEYARSLREYSVFTPGQGRHYNTERAQYSWRDYKLPTQIAAMRAISRFDDKFDDNKAYIRDMQMWLIRQKEVQAWDNVLNTIDAVDVLLGDNTAWLFHQPMRPEVSISGTSIDMGKANEALGYYKKSLSDEEVEQVNTNASGKRSSSGNLVAEISRPATVSANDAILNGETPVSWGTIYVERVATTSGIQESGKELTIKREYLVETKGKDGKTTQRALKRNEKLELGQRVVMRLTITSDRDMDFVSVRNQLASCFEPVDVLSGYVWSSGQGYYRSVHDSSTDLFFDMFRRGTCTIDLPFNVVRSGEYLDGLANVQCAYSTGYSGHSEGKTINVE